MTTPSVSYPRIIIGKELPNTKRNILNISDQPVHDWYRFVLSYPPQLVRKYLSDFNIDSSKKVLDPFCGTGTTNVECKLLNIENIGIEANPFPYFASKVKTNWNINPKRLISNSQYIANVAISEIKKTGYLDGQYTELTGDELFTLSEASEKLLITNSISPLPKHKSIILLNCIRRLADRELVHHQELAFAKALVFQTSNLVFGPEVGVGRIKQDVPIVFNWLNEIIKIAYDIQSINDNSTQTDIYQIDSRELSLYLEPKSIDAVITSPPYPNEKDYTRTTRLESVFLNFINNK
ncbi:MAG: DNA methyltransferase, partial [Anaerolineaceae bacterium]|nr:DNA methyltransferase [Anaerolineaceae bacterium]